MHVIEKIAFKKTMDMLEYVRPVVIFVIDATLGISHRDMTLLAEINRLALPIIFALNKSDLMPKKDMEAIIKNTQRMMDFAKYIPILPISALTGDGTKEFFAFVHALRKESEKRIPTTELNKIITTEFFQRPPRFPKNKICKIMYMTQVDINAPTFLVFVNHKTRANFSFKKWIENSIRKHFGFVGVPLVIRFKDRKE
jgi:GTP-binding protein